METHNLCMYTCMYMHYLSTKGQGRGKTSELSKSLAEFDQFLLDELAQETHREFRSIDFDVLFVA